MNSNEVFIHLTRLEYNPGEVVSGAILVRLTQPIRATGILLKLTGRERSSWIDAKKGQAEPVISHRHYFKTLIQVATFSANEDHIGEYRFPFSFTLPRNIPGSRVFEFGSVSSTILYKVKAVVEQLGVEKSHIKRTQTVHVKQTNPLNQVLARNDPPKKYCLCMQVPGLAIEVTPSKAAYQAGEILRLFASVNNRTNNAIDFVTVSLLMHVNLTSSSWSDVTLGQRKQFSTDHIIATSYFPSIKAKGVIPYCELAFPIPKGIGQHCFGHTIRVFYSVELTATMKGGSAADSNLSANIPVAIYPSDGSVPHYKVPGHGFHPKTYQGIVGHLPSTVPAPSSFPMYLFKNIAPVTSSNPGPQKPASQVVYPGKEFLVVGETINKLALSAAAPSMQTITTVEACVMTDGACGQQPHGGLGSAEVSSLLSPGNLTFGGDVELQQPYYTLPANPLNPPVGGIDRPVVPTMMRMEQVSPQSPVSEPSLSPSRKSAGRPTPPSQRYAIKFTSAADAIPPANLLDKFAAA